MSNLEAIVVPTSPSERIDRVRTEVAVGYFQMASQGKEVYVLVTGYTPAGWDGSQSQAVVKHLREMKVPSDIIEVDEHARNTQENVVNTSARFKTGETNQATISTDWWHFQRFKTLYNQAKKVGYAPEDLEVYGLTEGNEASYPLPKAIIAYGKDWILSRIGLPEPIVE